MIMELPREFSKVYNNGWYIIIRKGALEIHGGCNFRELMYEITYRLKGKKRCHYCHKRMKPEECTIDHLFPQDFGGVSITDNLEPTCANCNNDKRNLNEMEYKIWKTISSEKAKKTFYRKAINKKTNQKCDQEQIGGFDLPESWVTIQKLSLIRKATRTHGEAGLKKASDFVKIYGKLPYPLVLSKNQVVLSGISAYMIAKEMDLSHVPVIILENVMYYNK